MAEQVSLLHIIFYLFFDGRYLRSHLLSVTRLLSESNFGSKQLHFALLNDEGRAAVATLNALSGLIFIEAFQLESLYSTDPGEQCQHFLFTEPEIAKGIHDQVREFQQRPQAHHGPVFLAWSIARAQLLQSSESAESSDYQSIQIGRAHV